MNYTKRIIIVGVFLLLCCFFSETACFAFDIDSINLGQSKAEVEKSLQGECRFLSQDNNHKSWYQWVEDNYIAVCYDDKNSLIQIERFFPVSDQEEAKGMLAQGIFDYQEYFQQDPKPWNTNYLQEAVIWNLGNNKYYYLGICQTQGVFYMVHGKYLSK